jgi:citrate synthase
MIHEGMRHFFEGFPPGSHPMAVLSAMVTSLSAYYPDCLDRSAPMDLHLTRILSKVRTIAAFSYKKSIGQPIMYPKQRAQLLRELPAHDVRGAGRAVRAGSDRSSRR